MGYKVLLSLRGARSTKQSHKGGQAMISLLFLLTIIFAWMIEIVTINLSSLNISNEDETGQNLLFKGESYAENGALRYLRNPSYTGETLQDGGITCIITLTDNLQGGKNITSACQKDNRKRTLYLTVSVANGIFTFSKIGEQ